MQTPPDAPRPADIATPSLEVNNVPPPALPVQPHAPTWPYAPNAAPPPYYAAPAAYAPIPTEPDAPTPLIGPEHVPWRWYDMLLPALPLSFGIFTAVLEPLLPRQTSSDVAEQVLSTSDLLKLLLVGVAVYGFIAAMIWVFAVLKYRVPWSALGLRNAPGRYWAFFPLIVIGMYVASGAVSLLIAYSFFGGKPPENPQIKSITGGGGFSWPALVIALISASVVAPIVEELFFRGMLYGWLRTRWRAVGAVGAVTADGILFAAPHVYPVILASIFVVGVVLAIVYERTKSTLATMALHSAFNTIGVLLVFGELLRK